MKRSLSPRRALLISLAFCVAGAGAVPAVADDPAPPAEPSPFAPLVERIALSEPAILGTQTLVLLWTPKEPPVRATPAAARPWVGLAGTDVRVLDLPAPIGDGLVLVSNPLNSPLYLPRGEALVPGFGPARVIDRPAWIAAGSSTFVAVRQASSPPSAGPYEGTDERPSPESLRAMRLGVWPEYVATQTLTFERAGPWTLDPLRGYAVGVFPKDATVPVAAVETLRASVHGAIVGFAVGDQAGATTIVLESDAARLRVQWPAIARGIALDEVTRHRRGMPALAQPAGFKLVASVGPILRELAAPPTLRPAFGEGEQARWPADDAPARWIGLIVDGAPITATFHRREFPGPVPAPAGATPGSPPTNPPTTDEDTPPGQSELERRGGLTGFEERLKERREGRSGGPGDPERPAPGGAAGGGVAPGAGAGGSPSGGGTPSGGGAPAHGGGSAAPSGGASGGGASSGGGSTGGGASSGGGSLGGGGGGGHSGGRGVGD